MEVSKIKAAGAAVINGDWVDSQTFPGVSWRLLGSMSREVKEARRKFFKELRPQEQDSIKGNDIVNIRVLREVAWGGVAGLTNDDDEVSIDDAKKYLDDIEFATWAVPDLLLSMDAVGQKHLVAEESDAKN